MRGKGAGGAGAAAAAGITPAYAGKRPAEIEEIFGGGDHPRICGEKVVLFDDETKEIGSPPHMRGKAAQAALPYLDTRITPAYAGKRRHQTVRRQKNEDHPRICGEKYSRYIFRMVSSGSPPHMRGKGLRIVRVSALPGITPAYAGKRQRGRAGLGPGKDHPRICGEKTKKIP